MKRTNVYKCKHCGNIVEVTHVGGGQLVCCGEAMELLAENTTDAAQEKHVPALEWTADGLTVTVGSVAHPMEEKHYIEWIEVIDGETIHLTWLKPGDKPVATFPVTNKDATVRAYCNLHGLWKA